MDLIPWAIGFIAGITFPSFRRALVVGLSASIVLRLYQLVAGGWGDTMPEDLFGAAAMLLVTAMFTWVGSIVRAARMRRAEATS
jgi:hypothetical protein